MSKFHLNLLLQISKAFLHSKIQFLFEKEFFLHFRPNRPSGQPAHLAFQPTQPPDLSSSSCTKARCRRRHRSCAAVQCHPRLHPAKGALPRAPHRIPCLLPLLPSSFRRVKHRLKSEPFHPINAGNSSALTTLPPPRPL
jgi:hypothetical protein